MFGVSPAFVLSGWGESFTPDDYAGALEVLARLGFQGFQLEVFFENRLGDWSAAGVKKVAARARELGLRPTQFVAHFLTGCLDSPQALRSRQGLEAMREVMGILDGFPDCPLVTLPVGPFQADWRDPQQARPEEYEDLRGRFTEKLAAILQIVSENGRALALEILPRSFLAGTSGFLQVAEAIGSGKLGYNFDTGHAWACKEDPALIPLKLGRRVFGTHLCDNFGHENLKLGPGSGSIPWQPVLDCLRGAGYRGSLDLEIRCPAENLEAEYRRALLYLQSILPSQDTEEPRS